MFYTNIRSNISYKLWNMNYKIRINTVTFKKQRNVSFEKPFSAQYFRLTKTNKDQDFDIFL
jgi:hypothetical protein